MNLLKQPRSAGHHMLAFQAQYAVRDAAAGIITGTMAIPLSVGIAMMSDYPIKVGLATVVFASLIGWMFAWFKPGRVNSFGIQNMAFCIFFTAVMQAIIWKCNWQGYLLVAVPVSRSSVQESGSESQL